MRSSLLFVSLLALLAARGAAGQEVRGAGAYPMNVEDRIAIAAGRGRYVISDDDDHIGRAGAFPTNVEDRIKQAQIAAARSEGYAGQFPITAQGFEPVDKWRYVQFQNRWWYYDQDRQRLYWSAGRWNRFRQPTASATQ